MRPGRMVSFDVLVVRETICDLGFVEPSPFNDVGVIEEWCVLFHGTQLRVGTRYECVRKIRVPNTRNFFENMLHCIEDLVRVAHCNGENFLKELLILSNKCLCSHCHDRDPGLKERKYYITK